jgi:hypothetical protein
VVPGEALCGIAADNLLTALSYRDAFVAYRYPRDRSEQPQAPTGRQQHNPVQEIRGWSLDG